LTSSQRSICRRLRLALALLFGLAFLTLALGALLALFALCPREWRCLLRAPGVHLAAEEFVKAAHADTVPRGLLTEVVQR
jgi:hypothetical protein